MTTIQDALAAAQPGDTITIPNGTYDVGDLTLPGNVTLSAPNGATIVGNLHMSGPNTTVEGFTFQGGTVDMGSTEGGTVQNCVFNGGQLGVTYDGADHAHILNNSFNDIAGNGIEGWGLNNSTISGNHFADVTQGMSLDFNNDPTHGLNDTVDHNTFVNTARMPIEVGPGGAYTSNLVIEDNWSDNSHLANPASDGGVAYSIISTNGNGTEIDGNYAIGDGGPGIGIEMDGSGEIHHNYMDSFDYGIIAYGSGFNVHDNVLPNTSIDPVLNYANRDGTMQNNTTQPDSAMLAELQALNTSGSATDPVPTTTDGTSDPVHTADASGSVTADPVLTATDGTSDPVHTADASSSTADPALTATDGTSDPVHTVDASTSTADPAPTTTDGTSDPVHTADASGSSTADPAPTTTDGTSDPVHTADASGSTADPAPTTTDGTSDPVHTADASGSTADPAPTTTDGTSDPVPTTTDGHAGHGHGASGWWTHAGTSTDGGHGSWHNADHWAASTADNGSGAGNHGGWAHAFDAHAAADASGAQHPFAFSGILHHCADHVG